MSETKKSTSLVKRVLANVAEELEPYESPDIVYELTAIFTTGRPSTPYRICRTLATVSKLVKTLTKER
jgi:triosephosphate isomerase